MLWNFNFINELDSVVWPSQRETPAKLNGLIFPSAITSFSLGVCSDPSLPFLTLCFQERACSKTDSWVPA